MSRTATPTPVVKVQLLDRPKEWSLWHIELNISDRFGDLQLGDLPGRVLAGQPKLYEQLLHQMWDEITFIVLKDAAYGLLYEVEYMSQESEAQFEATYGRDPTLKPQAVVTAYLLDALRPLAKRYPRIQFAVPHPDEVANARPAVWAFVPNGLLHPEERHELGMALLEL